MTKEQIIADSKEFSLFSWSAQAGVNPIAIEKQKVSIYMKLVEKELSISHQD